MGLYKSYNYSQGYTLYKNWLTLAHWQTDENKTL